MGFRGAQFWGATRLLWYLADDQGLVARNPKVSCTLTQFTQQHPLTFDGKAEVLDAENWIKRMEKIFRSLFCTDEQKVEYATYVLANESDEWWTSTRELLLLKLGEGVPITWDHFKRTFWDQFFCPALREVKARQFTDLVQGTMTVECYAMTFVALSRFASYLVLDEEKKCEKLERGLHPRIQSRLISLWIRNFTDLITRATLIEEDMKANVELFDQRKRQLALHVPNRNKKHAPSYRPPPPQSISMNPVTKN
ncbi:uncharacterized protein LOC118347676 [Juglans regia]|uniref:Uncharacterized protein LOC118347676 n=1 Tax=Juglans regia TaxID=51240 RepID=A0A6P9E819_JUGRE|nr:uncharacterized protein LOC118347676 [Juglans regia]